VRAVEQFSRPVGGRWVAQEIVEYLCKSEGIVSVYVWVRAGSTTRGPVDLLTSPDQGTHLWRNGLGPSRVYIEARYDSTQSLDSLDIDIAPLRTRVKVVGSDHRLVSGECKAIRDVLAAPRRILSRLGMFLVTLAALMTVGGFLLAMSHS
jgi:hypothetical protein